METRAGTGNSNKSIQIFQWKNPVCSEFLYHLGLEWQTIFQVANNSHLEKRGWSVAAFGWKFLNPSVHSVKSYLRFSAIILQHCQSSCPVSPWNGNGKYFSGLETPKILKTRNGEGKREAGRDPVTAMTFFRLIFFPVRGEKGTEWIHSSPQSTCFFNWKPDSYLNLFPRGFFRKKQSCRELDVFPTWAGRARKGQLVLCVLPKIVVWAVKSGSAAQGKTRIKFKNLWITPGVLAAPWIVEKSHVKVRRWCHNRRSQENGMELSSFYHHIPKIPWKIQLRKASSLKMGSRLRAPASPRSLLLDLTGYSLGLPCSLRNCLFSFYSQRCKEWNDFPDRMRRRIPASPTCWVKAAPAPPGANLLLWIGIPAPQSYSRCSTRKQQHLSRSQFLIF